MNILNDHTTSVKENNLYIAPSLLCDNGVFSNTPIALGEIIELCPVILFTEKDMEFLKYTNLYNYYSPKIARVPGILPLGYGAIYNHSAPSNAAYSLDVEKKILTITAAWAIEANVEITINYNGRYDDNTAVLFAQKNDVYEFSINLF